MKYIKRFESKPKYPILYNDGDYVVTHYVSDENPLGIFIVNGNKKRVGVSPTVYYLYDVISDSINASADEKYIRLATPEEIEEFEIYTDVKKYNL
jgi:hypothetical protein